MRVFLILFIVMPIVEMLVLIKVGTAIGALPTIGLVLLTAMVGLALLKQQGLSALVRAQEKMQAGTMPINEMVEGIFLAVGGALLLTPGFITDAVGFCCLLPGIRQFIIARGIKLWKPNVVVYTQSAKPPADGSNNTIEGQFKRED